MKRVMLFMGTGSEAIKLCPLVRELRSRSFCEAVVCSTGLHRTMPDGVLEAFDVAPDFDMDFIRTGRSAADLTACILKKADEIFVAEKPDLLLIQGDTTTAFSAALAAFHRRIPIGHIEAGLRTYHIHDPLPEEFHRQAISLFADWHFAPSVSAKRNLIREGRYESRIFVTGNTLVDALRYTLSKSTISVPMDIPEDARLVMFIARREDSGETIRGMLRALRRIAETYSDIHVVLPVHYNPQVQAVASELLRGLPRVHMISTLNIISFHRLLARSYLVLTDSGGVQEETTALGIPTLVTRYSSERTEGIQTGCLKLAGSGEEGIATLAIRLLEPDSEEYRAMIKPSAVYGDANASKRIANVIEKIL